MNYQITGRVNVTEILEKIMLLTLGFVPNEDQTFVIDGAKDTDRLALAIYATYHHANPIYSVRWIQTVSDEGKTLADFVKSKPAGIVLFDGMRKDDHKEEMFLQVSQAAREAGHKIIRINWED